MTLLGNKVRLRRSTEDYPLDVTRVQRAIVDHGYVCSREDAKQLWILYSESLAANWLTQDGWSMGGIWKAVEPFIEVIG